MNKRHFHFQDLPVERLRHVFKYLAPHDLANPFERLKQQFDIMLAQQPLCLPNNRQMSIQLYYYYLKKIVSKHASQIVYFHLSERSAPCAIDSFLPEVPLNKLTWLSLKASLSLDVDYHRFYCDQYDECFDFVIAIQVLNLKFSINGCSRELLTELLNNGHLPQLQNTRVTFSIAHDNIENELLLQISLKHAFASELRHTNRKIYAGVAWSVECVEDAPVNDYAEEIDTYELDYVEDERLVQLAAIHCWHHLREINLEGDYPDDTSVVGDNISHLLHTAQRSLYFSELYIELDLDYGCVLSLNKQLGRLLGRQLSILHFTTKEANSSLGDLVRVIDNLGVNMINNYPNQNNRNNIDRNNQQNSSKRFYDQPTNIQYNDSNNQRQIRLVPPPSRKNMDLVDSPLTPGRCTHSELNDDDDFQPDVQNKKQRQRSTELEFDNQWDNRQQNHSSDNSSLQQQQQYHHHHQHQQIQIHDTNNDNNNPSPPRLTQRHEQSQLQQHRFSLRTTDARTIAHENRSNQQRNRITNESTRYAQTRFPFQPFVIRFASGNVKEKEAAYELVNHYKDIHHTDMSIAHIRQSTLKCQQNDYDLLIYVKDSLSFITLFNQQNWPKKIGAMEFTFPSTPSFPPQLAFIIKNVDLRINMDDFTKEVETTYPEIHNVIRLKNKFQNNIKLNKN
ncbi:unnamed protein product [Rotaria socialis]|uniref:F-box domain-containing protein n=3 Tax=Rotaria TaxID=231623 RepID=A0A821CH59_9BILA|nr:unnamed protein product [Rotaria socialis]